MERAAMPHSQCRLPTASSDPSSPATTQRKNPISDSATWLESRRQEKYVTILGLITIYVFLVFFYVMPFTDFCGSPNLETFISKEMGTNKATTRCWVQVISRCSGFVPLPPFYRCVARAQRG